MKHIQYDHNDAELIQKRFSKLKMETIHKLCQYLQENNLVIDAEDCYDAQSGWSGTEFKVGKADLSSNRYCLSNEQVELFVSGGQTLTLPAKTILPELRLSRLLMG